jgi:hypothetical protein
MTAHRSYVAQSWAELSLRPLALVAFLNLRQIGDCPIPSRLKVVINEEVS